MAKPKKYKPVRLKRWKVLKVAARSHRMGLALRAIGLPKLPGTIRRLYTPQTEAARRQGWPLFRKKK